MSLRTACSNVIYILACTRDLLWSLLHPPWRERERGEREREREIEKSMRIVSHMSKSRPHRCGECGFANPTPLRFAIPAFGWLKRAASGGGFGPLNRVRSVPGGCGEAVSSAVAEKARLVRWDLTGAGVVRPGGSVWGVVKR